MSNSKFNQVAVWRATVVGTEKVQEFESWMKEEFGGEIKYIKELKTRPTENGSGGRNDVLFYVHDDIIESFAIKRFEFGGEISWLEDVLDNESSELYPLYSDKDMLEVNKLRNW